MIPRGRRRKTSRRRVGFEESFYLATGRDPGRIAFCPGREHHADQLVGSRCNAPAPESPVAVFASSSYPSRLERSVPSISSVDRFTTRFTVNGTVPERIPRRFVQRWSAIRRRRDDTRHPRGAWSTALDPDGGRPPSLRRRARLLPSYDVITASA